MVLNSVRTVFRVKDLVYGTKRSTRLCFIKQFHRIYQIIEVEFSCNFVENIVVQLRFIWSTSTSLLHEIFEGDKSLSHFVLYRTIYKSYFL